MAKLCTNCKHARRGSVGPESCIVLRTEKQDLVTGKVVEGDVYSCEFMRSDFIVHRLLGGGRCGAEGLLFEAEQEEAA